MWQALLVVADVVALWALWAAAPVLRGGLVAVWPFDLVPGPVPVLRGVDPELVRAAGAVVVGGWLGVLALRGRYRRPEEPEAWMRALTSALAAALVVSALLYLVKLPHLSRTLLVGFGALTLPVLGATRQAVRSLARLPLGDPTRLALVGPDGALLDYEGRLARHPEWRAVVAARVPSDQVDAVVALAEAVTRTPVDAVRVVGMRPDVAHVADLAALCAELGLSLTVDVDVWGVRAHGVEAAGGGVTFRFSPERLPGMRAKRALDVVGALTGLVVLGPLLLLLAALIRLVDGGPAFHVQTRAGLHGRTFRMVKLRTMVPDAEARLEDLRDRNEVDGPAFKLTGDPRVTPLGRLLRKSSLDELPQLLHVLVGDMSLVGPRPPLPGEVAQYTRAQRRRLSMRPGLTGLWQVSGRSALPFDDGFALDLAYIDGWSLALDVRVLLATVPAVISARGAW